MKKSTDGVIYDQHFDMQHNIDEKLKDPNLKLKFGDREYSLAEINNLFPSTEKKIDMFIEWDNMCQYSAFGIISKVNEIIKEDRKLNIHEFVRRDEYPNCIDYVKKAIYPDLDPNLIDGVITKFYSDIMARSPVTSFFAKMDLMKFMLNSVTFMFRYPIQGLNDFVENINETKFNSEVHCKAAVYQTEEEEIFAVKRFPLNEIYVVPDMGLYYKAMIDYDKRNTTLLSYENHNGMSPFILSYYLNDFVKAGLEGPNDINLSFLQEYSPDENDEKKLEEEKKKQEEEMKND